MNAVLKTKVLLHIEDSPGDADLLRELLSGSGPQNYQIVHVPRLSDAVERLRTMDVDVVVLDLRLPDCDGPETVRTVRLEAAEVPIVVLTGTDDDALAHACISAGAQDYLAKNELRAQSIRRAIGCAITRKREIQLAELQSTLERYRSMSSARQGTTVTAALAGSGAVSLRYPAEFDQISAEYFGLLEPYLSRRADRVEAKRERLEEIATHLGDLGAGPRDMLDIHVAALDRALASDDTPHSRTVVFEARLLALEMMGLLVDYYRVGHRRRSAEVRRP